MKRSEQLLRKAFPGREGFSVMELEAVEGVLGVLGSVDDRSSRLPMVFIEIGDLVEHYGHVYRCVERPKGIEVCMACSGCDFDRKHRQCFFANLQCSSFDRRDRKSVWFVEEDV